MAASGPFRCLEPAGAAGAAPGDQRRALPGRACAAPAARASSKTSIPPYSATAVEKLLAGRERRAGQDQYRRVRDGLLHRKLGLRHHPQPLGHWTRVPGGSSGGSAAAVAARMAPARSAPTPAAACASPPPSAAWPGIKPTYGRVSRYGLVAFGSSLDQVGRSRARWPTPPCSSRPSPATTRRIPPRVDVPAPALHCAADAPATSRAARRRAQGVLHRGHRSPRSRARGARGHRASWQALGATVRESTCPTPSMPCRSTT